MHLTVHVHSSCPEGGVAELPLAPPNAAITDQQAVAGQLAPWEECCALLCSRLCSRAGCLMQSLARSLHRENVQCHYAVVCVAEQLDLHIGLSQAQPADCAQGVLCVKQDKVAAELFAAVGCDPP